MNNIKYLFSRLNKTQSIKRFLSAQNVSTPSSSNYNWLLVIPLASFGLGTWQVHRLQWKRNKIRDLEIRSQAAALPLPSDILEDGKVKEMEYKRVLIRGHFDHSKEVFLGPRSLNNPAKGAAGGGLISRPQTGYQILTPFVLENGDRVIVNRGWVPKELKDASKRQDGQIIEEVCLTGYVRSGERRPQFSPKVVAESLNWHYCDVANISVTLNTLPLLIEADSQSSVPGGPVGGQTRVTLRNEHMQYIITWYSLSAATLYLYFQLRKRPALMFRDGPS